MRAVHTLSYPQLETLELWLSSCVRRVLDRVHTHHAQKLDAMRRNRHIDPSKLPDAWVLNLSFFGPGPSGTCAAQVGAEICPHSSVFSVCGVHDAILSALSRLRAPEQEKRTLEIRVLHVLSNVHLPPSNLSRPQGAALTRLARNHNILITPADKGNLTVVIDKVAYDAKVDEFVAGQLSKGFCHRLTHDPAPAIKRKFNTLLRSLLAQNEIPRGLRWSWDARGWMTPRLYGLIKAHKPDHPIKPIVAARCTSSYRCARFVAHVLRRYVVQSPTTVWSSWTFAQAIRGFVVPPEYWLVSFDVVSLYPSVPLARALPVVDALLHKDDFFCATHTRSPQTR